MRQFVAFRTEAIHRERFGMANLKNLIVDFDGTQVINVATGLPVPSEMPFGKKGKLELREDEDGTFFVCINGTGDEVYTLDLRHPGEFMLTTTDGEWLPSDEEKAAMRQKAELEERIEANKRRAMRRDMAAGRHALSVATSTRHTAGETYVTEVQDENSISINRSGRWQTDGTITRTPVDNPGGPRIVRVEITGATWAYFHPFHLHVWPGFQPDDDFVYKLGMDVNILQDIASGR